MMIIDKIETGMLAVNTYIAHLEGRNDCVVIDPGNSHKVEKLLAEKGLSCTHILLTHGHFDHTMGVADLKENQNVLVYIHKEGVRALENGEDTLAILGGAFVKPCKVDKALSDGDEFTAAGIDFKVLHTPGHTKDGVCYIVESEKVIFSGDTLFRLSVGRTDFAGGDKDALYDSLNNKLFRIQGDYRVLPGHNRETRLEFERENNPFVKNFGENF